MAPNTQGFSEAGECALQVPLDADTGSMELTRPRLTDIMAEELGTVPPRGDLDSCLNRFI